MSSAYSILEDPILYEVIDFVNKVRMEFADNREKYNEFLTILKDARSATNLRGIKARMEKLLRGHTHLIKTFRTFLPKEYQITLDECRSELNHTVIPVFYDVDPSHV
ncbi:unnamed protein product [Trifolium pratense]|uniref:Uncharacterized protein n=1 Tax=Trifolium pratense TaxID=57577 RepID=A0ACB0KS71_TRIPR|nr:unnamed protein product [Trifolium pratense]